MLKNVGKKVQKELKKFQKVEKGWKKVEQIFQNMLSKSNKL